MKDGIHHFMEKRGRFGPKTGSRPKHDPWAPLLVPVSWYLARKGRGAGTDSAFAEDGEKAYWAVAARHMVSRHALEQAVRGLARAGIPVLVLKGMAFAETLYPSPGLRPTVDMDVLVRPGDLEAAHRELRAMGWAARREGGGSPEIATWPGRDVGQVAELVLCNGKGVTIELHWHLIPYVWQRRIYSVDMDEVWSRAEPLAMKGLGQAMGLSPVHTLAYLCLHQALHGLGHVKGYLDADLFVRKVWGGEQGPWDAFVACARAWRIRAAAFHVLRLTRFLFGTPVPAGVLGRLDPGSVSRGVIQGLYPSRALLTGEEATGRRHPDLVRALLVDRIWDLVRLARHVVLPSASWRRYRYGKDASLFVHWKHALEILRR